MKYSVAVKPELRVTFDDVEAANEQEAFDIACQIFHATYDDGFIDIDNPAISLDEIECLGE